MIKLDQIPQTSKVKGQYTVNRISEDELWLEVLNNQDGSTFEMKVATYQSKLEEEKLTPYEDDSFDMESSNSKEIQWKKDIQKAV